MNNSRIYTYRVYTLVDVTHTGITRHSTALETQRNQQRNWESVIQILGLRTQLMRINQLDLLNTDISQYKFGESYTGTQNIWRIDFDVEYKDVYKIDNNPFKILIDDFNQVPVIINLNETAIFNLPLFYTDGPHRNIYFEILNYIN